MTPEPPYRERSQCGLPARPSSLKMVQGASQGAKARRKGIALTFLPYFGSLVRLPCSAPGTAGSWVDRRGTNLVVRILNLDQVPNHSKWVKTSNRWHHGLGACPLPTPVHSCRDGRRQGDHFLEVLSSKPAFAAEARGRFSTPLSAPHPIEFVLPWPRRGYKWSRGLGRLAEAI